eukprot:IDg20056t1
MEERAARRREQNAASARRSRKRHKMNVAALTSVCSRYAARIRCLEKCIEFLVVAVHRASNPVPSSHLTSVEKQDAISANLKSLLEVMIQKNIQPSPSTSSSIEPQDNQLMQSEGKLAKKGRSAILCMCAPEEDAAQKDKRSQLPDGEKMIDEILAIFSNRKL